MPELQSAAAAAVDLGWNVLAFRLVLAMLLGLLIAAVYAITQRRPAGQLMPLIVTLVLLTILVAITTIVIGDSIARAFGLVGALSIVRFRTVVDDTRDTSFVIFAVVVGMASGAGNFKICLVGVPLVILAVVGLSLVGTVFKTVATKRLDIRLGAGRDPEVLLNSTLDEQTSSWKLVSVASARQGAAMDLIYHVKLKAAAASMLPLIKAIHALDGVQSVEMKDE